MLKQIITILIFLISISGFAQSDQENIDKIYKTSLTNGKSYEWLDYLSNQIGGKEELDKLGLDKVWLQPVMVPKWVRGNPEYAYIETTPGNTTTVNICALGGSMATPSGGLVD